VNVKLAWEESAADDMATFHVFPLSENSKIPAIHSAGFKDALPIDKAKIKWPGIMDGNYGVVPGRSGHIVFDIDVKDGCVGKETFDALQNRYGKLPDTMVVTTPSGGFHIYFKRPESLPEIGNISIGKHIDTRCDHGYVLGVGSNINGSSYPLFKDDPCADLPEKWVKFIEDIVNEKPAAQQKQPVFETGTGIIADDVKEALKHIPNDDRDTWLHVGMALKSTDAGDESYHVWTAWSSTSAKFNADDQWRVWNSTEIEGGIHIESIFAMAMKHGWVNAPKLDPQVTPIEIVEQAIGKRNAARDTVYPPIVYQPNGIGAAITDYIIGQSIRVQPVLAFASAIAASCVIIGRKYQTVSGLRANIPMITLAGTGMGKEGGRTGIKNILGACKMTESLGGESIKSGQGLVSAMERNPNSIFLLDEFGRFLKAAGNLKSGSHLADVITEMMKMHSSANSVYLGAEFAVKKDRPQVRIEYPLCNIYATSTPTLFWESLSADALVSGELNRFCIFDGSAQPTRQRIKRRSPDASISEWAANINNPTYATGLDGVMPDCPIIVGEMQDAEDILDAYANDCDAVLFDPAVPEYVKAAQNRSHARACQLAMLFALWDNDGTHQPVIDATHAANGVALVKALDAFLLDHIKDYFATSQFEREMLDVVRAIKAMGADGVAPSRAVKDIKALRAFRVRDRNEIIQLAIEADYLVVVERQGAGNKPVKRLIHIDHMSQDDVPAL